MVLPFHQRVALVSGILLTFFLLLFGGVAYFKIKFYVDKEVSARQLQRMKTLQLDIHSWMIPSMRHVEELAQELEEYAPFEKQNVVPLLANAKKSIDAVQVYFGIEDGRMMYDTGKELNKEWYDPRKRPWYHEGLAVSEAIVSNPFVGFASNQLTLTIMTPVFVKELKQGVVAASFYVNKLYAKIKAIPMEEGYAFVVNRDGEVVMHSDKSMVAMQLTEQNDALKNLYKTMQEEEEGLYLYEDENNKELMSFGTLHNGWFVVVSTEYDKAYGFVDALLKLLWIMGVLMIVLTVMVLMRMTQKSIRHG